MGLSKSTKIPASYLSLLMQIYDDNYSPPASVGPDFPDGWGTYWFDQAIRWLMRHNYVAYYAQLPRPYQVTEKGRCESMLTKIEAAELLSIDTPDTRSRRQQMEATGG